MAETSQIDTSKILLVARTELRRSYRKLNSNTKAAAMTVIGAGFGLLYSVGLGVGSYFFVRSLVSEGMSPESPLAVGVTLTGTAAFVGFFTLQRTVKSVGTVDEDRAVLSATSHYNVFLGVLLGEVGRWLAAAVFPVVVLSVGVGAGARSALAFGLTGAVLLLLMGLGVTLGFTAGVFVKVAAARSRLVASHRTSLSLVASVVSLTVYFFFMTEESTGRIVSETVGYLPSSWLGDLILVSLPVSAGDLTRGLGGLTVCLMVITLGVVASGRLTRSLWFSDSLNSGTANPDTSSVFSLFEGRLPKATLRTADKSWKRARRAPFTLQYAFVPVFMLVYVFVMSVRSGFSPVVAPVTGAAVALSASSAFTLNPIGGEGSVLPLVLTSRVEPRQFLGGLVLGGITVGLPVSVLATAVVGVVGPNGSVSTAASVVLVAVMAAFGPLLSTGFGVEFPKFEKTAVQGRREAVVPSGWAYLFFVLTFGIVSAPGIIAQSGIDLVDSLLPLGGVGAVALSSALFVSASLLSFRHAVAVFEDYYL
ncbi:hypothetical protein ACEU6E_02495 [Halorutilales archaeon Cl-col2-1]